MSEGLVYRNVYAVVPRAVLTDWQHESWTRVIAAAERGEDGMSVLHGRPRRWHEPRQGRLDYAADDIAHLAQGQGRGWEDVAVLHQQNW